MFRPEPLKKGDRLAVVGGSFSTKHSAEELEAAVRSFGLEPVLYPGATGHYHCFTAPDAQRAADINAAFADDSVRGIVPILGGYGAQRILPLLDWETIKAHPKFFGGYSDVTAILSAINRICGMEVYHMPMVAGWAEGLDDYTRAHVEAVLFGEKLSYEDPEGYGRQCLIPVRYKEVLTILFGPDYMTPPPVEERVAKHLDV